MRYQGRYILGDTNRFIKLYLTPLKINSIAQTLDALYLSVAWATRG